MDFEKKKCELINGSSADSNANIGELQPEEAFSARFLKVDCTLLEGGWGVRGGVPNTYNRKLPLSVRVNISSTRKFGWPTATLFLTPAEGWKGPSGPAGDLWPHLK